MRARSALLLSALSCVLALAAGCGGEDEDSAAPAGVPFDRAFIDAMVPHHQDALEMARAAREAGLESPELQQVAADILSTQQSEIDRMLGWREDWYGSIALDPDAVEQLGLTPEEAGMEAHGQASFAKPADAEFASAMIAHHEGAIRMAKLAFDRVEHDELRELADAIESAQSREIEILEQHAGDAHHGG